MAIKNYLTQISDIYPAIMGADGIPGYAGTATYASEPCRFEPKSRQRQDDKGNLIITDGILFYGATAIISENDKIVHNSKSYIVVSMNTVYGFTGIHHFEVLVKSL